MCGVRGDPWLGGDYPKASLSPKSSDQSDAVAKEFVLVMKPQKVFRRQSTPTFFDQ
ncbi:MAG: hypothetical protein RLZZ408_815 [Verrucomicrobiota bacterium]